MTQLRQRMIECLQLRGLSERTQESYVRRILALEDGQVTFSYKDSATDHSTFAVVL